MSVAQNQLIYDDACPLCTFQMRVLTWVDWFNTVSLLPLSSGKAKEVASGISEEELNSAIHCFHSSGRVYRGARALRHVGMRMPLFFPIALLLWLPGVIQIAEWVYMWVSRNRHILSKWFGCKDACRLMPKREREQDVVAEVKTTEETN